MEIIEARRRARRTEPLEACHPVMEFLEDIRYCPSQIEFYFRSDGQVMSLYIRQRQDRDDALQRRGGAGAALHPDRLRQLRAVQRVGTDKAERLVNPRHHSHR